MDENRDRRKADEKTPDNIKKRSKEKRGMIRFLLFVSLSVSV